MNGTKSPLRSIGIMGPLAAIVVFVLNQLFPGLGLTEVMVGELVDRIVQLIDLVVLIAGLLVGMYGRWKATRAIGSAAVVLLALFVGACGALTGGTPAADVFAMRASYNAAVLAPAAAYASLPRCAAAVPQPCSEQAVVNQLRKADAAAKAALDAAETVVRDTPRVDARTAIRAATEAIAAVAAIAAIYGGK